MKSNQFRVVKKTINCFHSNIYFPWLLVYLPWLTGILKSPRCDIIDWHYDRGLNNSKLTVWSSITVADGGMRVWHFNGVITTYGKRDCRNSWRYASLAVNRGAIKRGFTVPYICKACKASGNPKQIRKIDNISCLNGQPKNK
jgi:hypothetical protein